VLNRFDERMSSPLQASVGFPVVVVAVPDRPRQARYGWRSGLVLGRVPGAVPASLVEPGGGLGGIGVWHGSVVRRDGWRSELGGLSVPGDVCRHRPPRAAPTARWSSSRRGSRHRCVGCARGLLAEWSVALHRWRR